MVRTICGFLRRRIQSLEVARGREEQGLPEKNTYTTWNIVKLVSEGNCAFCGVALDLKIDENCGEII